LPILNIEEVVFEVIMVRISKCGKLTISRQLWIHLATLLSRQLITSSL